MDRIGGLSRIFKHSLFENMKKLKEGSFGENNFEKVSQFRKNKGGLWDFSTFILSQNIQEIEGVSLGNFLSKKSHNAKK